MNVTQFIAMPPPTHDQTADVVVRKYLRLGGSGLLALRGMGFHYLEQKDINSARRHLQNAAEQKPNDPAVREALKMLADLPATPTVTEARTRRRS